MDLRLPFLTVAKPSCSFVSFCVFRQSQVVQVHLQLNTVLFLKDLCMCVGGCPRVWVPRETSSPIELEFQAAMSHSMWVLGTELQLSL